MADYVKRLLQWKIICNFHIVRKLQIFLCKLCYIKEIRASTATTFSEVPKSGFKSNSAISGPMMYFPWSRTLFIAV